MSLLSRKALCVITQLYLVPSPLSLPPIPFKAWSAEPRNVISVSPVFADCRWVRLQRLRPRPALDPHRPAPTLTYACRRHERSRGASNGISSRPRKMKRVDAKINGEAIMPINVRRRPLAARQHVGQERCCSACCGLCGWKKP